MTTYGEDFIKKIMEFEYLLKSKQYERVRDASNTEELLFEMKQFIVDLATSIQVLYLVAKSEMKETDRIWALLEKLPKTKEFDQLKNELEQHRKDSIEVLLPIKKLAVALEESKNRKLDYIG